MKGNVEKEDGKLRVFQSGAGLSEERCGGRRGPQQMVLGFFGASRMQRTQLPILMARVLVVELRRHFDVVELGAEAEAKLLSQ